MLSTKNKKDLATFKINNNNNDNNLKPSLKLEHICSCCYKITVKKKNIENPFQTIFVFQLHKN